MTRIESIHIDGAVVAVALALVVFSALFCSTIAALSVRDTQALRALSETSRSFSSSRKRVTMRRTLLTVELGMTVVLLIGAGLLLKSYQRLRDTDMGCATRNVLTMTLGLSGDRYKERAQVVTFYDTLLTRVRSLPGVTEAGFVRAVPGQGYMGDWGFTIAEHPPLPQGMMEASISRWRIRTTSKLWAFLSCGATPSIPVDGSLRQIKLLSVLRLRISTFRTKSP